jgi:mannosyltransferase OCH1-like enzyme
METINYMWGFRPGESKPFPITVVKNNARYIPSCKLITPERLLPLLNNDIFPNITELYNKIPNWVCKADLGRLLYIYFQGGLYADADCFIKKPLNVHKNHNIVLFVEKICDNINYGARENKNNKILLRRDKISGIPQEEYSSKKTYGFVANSKINKPSNKIKFINSAIQIEGLRIANFCFGSNIVQHPFLKEVIEECIRRLKILLYDEKKTNFTDSDILWVCGPDVITTIFHRSHEKYSDVFVYTNDYLHHVACGSWRTR